jgi:imidazole glycerol-phosphate synthase subunit HisH
MDKILICILDYGAGNVKSVLNIVKHIGCEVIISNKITDIKSATHLILPGVGAFGTAINKIKSQIPLRELEVEVLQKKKPFLGICVGMQVLLEKGFEHGVYDGLGWIPGSVKKIKAKMLPLPHIGWNDVIIKKESILFQDLNDVNDFYFVHSYAVEINSHYVLTETQYENKFCSSLQKDNIYGVQFHPEKSQRAGQKLIMNFLSTR